MAQSTALLRIGTRGSPLALVQAHMVQAQIAAALGAPKEAIEIVVIRTSGDRIQDRPLAEFGGKGLFTKEIEEALLDRRVDLAVHSSKDMPTISQPGLALTACLEREDPRDVFISHKATSLRALPLPRPPSSPCPSQGVWPAAPGLCRQRTRASSVSSVWLTTFSTARQVLRQPPRLIHTAASRAP